MQKVLFFIFFAERNLRVLRLLLKLDYMQKIILLLFMVFLTISSKAQLPDFKIRNIDNKLISLNDLKGEKLTVIDFWATWCKPCVSAIPKLNALYEEFSEKGTEFIGINVDGPRNQAKVKPFAISLNIKYPVVLDPNQDLVDEFNVTVFPTLIILDDKGKELFIHEGFNPGDETLLKEELTKLLNK